MTMTPVLGLEWGLGRQLLMLAELNIQGWEPYERIQEGIDCEHDEMLLSDLGTSSASKKN